MRRHPVDGFNHRCEMFLTKLALEVVEKSSLGAGLVKRLPDSGRTPAHAEIETLMDIDQNGLVLEFVRNNAGIDWVLTVK